MIIHTIVAPIYIDGWLEDSWSAATNDIADGKHKTLGQQPSLLEINPSYGVLPDIPENEAETNKVVDGEYEYIDVSPTSNEKPQSPLKKTPLTSKESEPLNDYEVPYI